MEDDYIEDSTLEIDLTSLENEFSELDELEIGEIFCNLSDQEMQEYPQYLRKDIAKKYGADNISIDYAFEMRDKYRKHKKAEEGMKSIIGKLDSNYFKITLQPVFKDSITLHVKPREDVNPSISKSKITGGINAIVNEGGLIASESKSPSGRFSPSKRDYDITLNGVTYHIKYTNNPFAATPKGFIEYAGQVRPL